MSKSIPLPRTVVCKELDSSQHDGLVLVATSGNGLPHAAITEALTPALKLDKAAESKGCVVGVSLPCQRLIFSPTGPVDRDYDDLRRFTDAGKAGIKRALAAGSKRPLVVVSGLLPGKSTEQAELATLLGCLDAAYTTLEMRETSKEKAAGKLELLGWAGADSVLQQALIIEQGRVVCRDIGGSDPERMAAPRVEEYVTQCFAGTKVSVEVQKGQEFFEREYPCLAAVNRAASTVPRHDGRVIWLTYKPEGTVKKTVYLVGKGITYDTGGADIKAGGVMAGMSRDKCGAAATAGLMASIAALQPQGVKVVGALAMVRNSVGANCYVADEIITSRAGVRIRVGNTDAEGRMAMVDVLCRARELALADPDPQLFTMATLTGHACLAVGDYSTIMDNGPARAAGTALKVQAAGEDIGDMFEISTVRREDWDFVQDKSGEFVSVLQCNNAPSSRTPRGHQFPAAFMMQVAGLDKHQANSSQPIKYSHMDIAGSSGYSIIEEDDSMRANGTSTLVIGEDLVVLVDTLSPWDKDILLAALAREGFKPEDVTHLVCTHGHPDHVGNNNLFTSAKMHIMGHAIHHKDVYRELEPEGLKLDPGGAVTVIATPGHTLDSVSLVVATGTEEQGTVVVAGDNFEKEEDLHDPDLWKSAGSEDEQKQMESRQRVLDLADWVVPGHGDMFPSPRKANKTKTTI